VANDGSRIIDDAVEVKLKSESNNKEQRSLLGTQAAYEMKKAEHNSVLTKFQQAKYFSKATTCP